MPIGKPILRVGKIKRSGRCCPTSVDNHLSRSVTTHNADAGRTMLNEWLVGSPGSLSQRIDRVLERAVIDKDALRKDATIANDVLLSVSPSWFRPDDPDAAGTYDLAKLAIFRQEAAEFLREQFGGRMAAAVLHLDESTPHVQAIIVPIVKHNDSFKLSGKTYFGPERLTQLQDAWEKRLAAHGVGPREKGSTATHTRVKTYYSGLQTAPDVPEPQPPSPPPLRALLPGGGDVLAQWQAAEVKKVKKRNKPLAQAAAKGMLYDAERAAGDNLRHQVQDQGRRWANLRNELTYTAEELALSKDKIALLRGISVDKVAVLLDYTGEIGKRENAIDLLKRVGGLNFEEATRWLAIAFDPAVAGAAVRHNVATTQIDKPILTSADQVKAKQIREQLNALGSENYRLTVMYTRDDGTKYAINLGKKDDGEELYDRHQVEAWIPRLTAHNARGGNIFITPMDRSVYHLLIDDLSAKNLETMKGVGYSFSTICETSPNNFQGVVKVPKTLPEPAVNEWFKVMNRELGDAKITNAEHAMRLAGFQNRKAKHRRENGEYPFVRVVTAVRVLCAHARAVITDMARQMRETPPTTSPRTPRR